MTTDIDAIARIVNRDEAERIGIAAYQALIEDLAGLGPEQWNTETVCAPWTVADIVRHLIGAAKANASLREMARQQLHGARHKARFDGNALDAANDLQVADHRHLEPAALVAELEAVHARSVRTRVNRSRIYDRIRIRLDSGGSTADGMPAKLSLGELFRVIYTRDVWLHRIDIARALGRQPELDDSSDRRLIEDVVKEWADRHGEPFDLRLEGDGGGHYRRGGDGPTIELDAIDFCWILSGRGEPAPETPGADLLRQRILF